MWSKKGPATSLHDLCNTKSRDWPYSPGLLVRCKRHLKFAWPSSHGTATASPVAHGTVEFFWIFPGFFLDFPGFLIWAKTFDLANYQFYFETNNLITKYFFQKTFHCARVHTFPIANGSPKQKSSVYKTMHFALRTI